MGALRPWHLVLMAVLVLLSGASRPPGRLMRIMKAETGGFAIIGLVDLDEKAHALARGQLLNKDSEQSVAIANGLRSYFPRLVRPRSVEGARPGHPDRATRLLASTAKLHLRRPGVTVHGLLMVFRGSPQAGPPQVADR